MLNLTPYEIRIVHKYTKGVPMSVMARSLNKKPTAVRTMIWRACKKVGAKTTAQLAVMVALDHERSFRKTGKDLV